MSDSRCVECGRPKSAHPADTLKCPNRKERYGPVFASMDLPEGKTCADCQHIRFCTAFIGDVAANTECDWFPVRFYPKGVITTDAH